MELLNSKAIGEGCWGKSEWQCVCVCVCVCVREKKGWSLLPAPRMLQLLRINYKDILQQTLQLYMSTAGGLQYRNCIVKV
jgi:hypothetical protein